MDAATGKVQLRLPFSCVISGATNTGRSFRVIRFAAALKFPHFLGKSHFVGKLLRHQNEILPAKFDKVYYFHGSEWQDMFTELSDELGESIEFIHGWNAEYLEKPDVLDKSTHKLLVVDDLYKYTHF